MSIATAAKVSRPTLATFGVLGIYWGAFAAYVPEIKAQIGASDGLFGLLLLGSAIGLVTSMWLAPQADRALGPWAMRAGALCLAAAFLLPGLASAPAVFALSMVVVGMASGLTDVVMNARVSELEAKHERSLMNLNHAGFSLAYAISAATAGLAREAAWPPVATFAVLGLVTCALLPRMRLAPAAVGAEHEGDRFPRKIVLVGGTIVLLAFLSEAATETWAALHVERTLGGRAAEGALGPAVLGLTMAVGRFSGQLVAERLSEMRVIVGASVFSAMGALIAASAPGPAMAYLGFAILGLGVSVIGPMGLALVGRLAPPGQRTVAISRAAVIGFCGFFVAPPLMGGISEVAGLRWAFVAIAILLLSVPLWTLRLRRVARA